MKMKLFAVFAAFVGAIIFVTGCVNTVAGPKVGGVPFIKDKVQGRYERPADEVFAAAKAVISANGVLASEGLLHGTNDVHVATGRVNQRRVWISVEQIDPKVSEVTVQTRTSGGGSDIDLAHDLEKQVALKLVR
jgi:predicted small secreted protein